MPSSLARCLLTFIAWFPSPAMGRAFPLPSWKRHSPITVNSQRADSEVVDTAAVKVDPPAVLAGRQSVFQRRPAILPTDTGQRRLRRSRDALTAARLMPPAAISPVALRRCHYASKTIAVACCGSADPVAWFVVDRVNAGSKGKAPLNTRQRVMLVGSRQRRSNCHVSSVSRHGKSTITSSRTFWPVSGSAFAIQAIWRCHPALFIQARLIAISSRSRHQASFQ